MSWKKITLDGDDIRRGIDDKIQEAFITCLEDAGWPEGAIMYGNRDTATEGYFYFFTPAAAQAADHLLFVYDAVDCPEPPAANLSVLVKRTRGGVPG